MEGDAGGETVVCVLGAPRSGTSLTTRILSLCGLYLGESDEMIPANAANEAGFWELRCFVDLNARILKRLGGTGYVAPFKPRGWEDGKEFDRDRDEAHRLVADTFGGRQAWGWKDPRNSITLPFWQQLLPTTRHVICFRDPLDSAVSGSRMAPERLDLDAAKALELWQHYVAAAIANTIGRPRLFVQYESYFDDWRQTVAHLMKFCGLPNPTLEVEQQIENLIDPNLRHHAASIASLEVEAELPESALSLFQGLRRVAEVDQMTRDEERQRDEAALDRLALEVLTNQSASCR